MYLSMIRKEQMSMIRQEYMGLFLESLVMRLVLASLIFIASVPLFAQGYCPCSLSRQTEELRQTKERNYRAGSLQLQEQSSRDQRDMFGSSHVSSPSDEQPHPRCYGQNGRRFCN